MTIEPSVDCHAHVFDKAHDFAPETYYRPHASQQGSAEQFLAVLDAHGFSHGLLINAVPYGQNNQPMLDAIAGSAGRLKGVAIIRDLQISEPALDRLAAGGVTGIRINIRSLGLSEISGNGAERFLAMIRERGWWVHLNLERGDLAAVAPLFREAGLKLVFDHFGRPDVALGIDQPGFREMLEFGREGNALVKLSAPFRCSRQSSSYIDVDRFIEAAVGAFTPDGCIWGSDWPFVLVEERIDYAPPLACLKRWLPDEGDRRKVLWETPSRCFGFSWEATVPPSFAIGF